MQPANSSYMLMAFTLIALLACSSAPASDDASDDEGSGRDGGPDAGKDPAHEPPDSSILDPYEACEAHRRASREFISSNLACQSDNDCVIVGSCSGGFGFEAVNIAASAEAQVFSDTTPKEHCGAFDGPTYYAVCDEGQCVALEDGGACGQYIGEQCPSGQSYYFSTCEPASSEDVAIVSGCYPRCGPHDASYTCPASLECQPASTSYTDCYDDTGDACVDCAAYTTYLCLPPPTCEVALSLDFEGRLSAELYDDSEIELVLRATNHSGAELSFSIAPCVLPELQGLGDYDAFEQCAAGACVETEPREITLLPSETVVLAQATLHRDPMTSACNPDGLAPGVRTLTFNQPSLTGATACGPLPIQLRVYAR